MSPLALLPTFGYVAVGEAMAPRSSEAMYDVRNFGGTGDGKTVDTPAVNKAICACWIELDERAFCAYNHSNQ